MPYKTVPKHLHGLTLAQANKWGEVFDAVRKAGGDDEKAARVAWGVVKKKMHKSVIAVRVAGYTRKGHTVQSHLRMVKHKDVRPGPGEHIVYRASDDDAPMEGTHFTEEEGHGIAYADNPGFGGKVVRRYAIKPETPIDTVGAAHHGIQALALAYLRSLDQEDRDEFKEKVRSALGRGDDEPIKSWDVAEYWRDHGYTHVFHVLENMSKVERAIEKNHDWIRFEDDFPEGSVTWKRLGGPAPLRKDVHPGMTLVPSKSNPAVKRWQAMDRGHSAEGHRFLGAVHVGGGKLPITEAESNRPHVKRMIKEKMIKLERNPTHHWNEYTAHITKAGRDYHDAYRAAHEDTGHQVSLFKGVVCIYLVRSGSLLKAIQGLDLQGLEKAVIPALDMVPEDIEGEAPVSTWTEGPYKVTWKRGRKGVGSVTFEGGDLPMPFVMTAAGGKHARSVASETAALLQKGKVPLLDGVFRMTRSARRSAT